MGKHVPTRCFVGGQPVTLKVLKKRGPRRELIERASQAAPIRATHVALKFDERWHIYTTQRWVGTTRVEPRLVLGDLTLEAAEMWLMYRGSNDG